MTPHFSVRRLARTDLRQRQLLPGNLERLVQKSTLTRAKIARGEWLGREAPREIASGDLTCPWSRSVHAECRANKTGEQ